MTQSPNDPPSGDATPNPPEPDSTTQEVRHQQISARVAEGVARGVFSTGVIVLAGPSEFVLDFVVRMSRPHRVAARVVLPPPVVPQVIGALRENVRRYEERFGPITVLPEPDVKNRPSIQEVYDELKLPDEQLPGCYANILVIGHTPAEFCLDFIANFFPRAAVSARVFLSAPQVPRMIEALSGSWDQHLRRLAARQQRPPETPETPESPENPGPTGPPDDVPPDGGGAI